MKTARRVLLDWILTVAVEADRRGYGIETFPDSDPDHAFGISRLLEAVQHRVFPMHTIPSIPCRLYRPGCEVADMTLLEVAEVVDVNG